MEIEFILEVLREKKKKTSQLISYNVVRMMRDAKKTEAKAGQLADVVKSKCHLIFQLQTKTCKCISLYRYKSIHTNKEHMIIDLL
jgi:hypothetical protein